MEAQRVKGIGSRRMRSPEHRRRLVGEQGGDQDEAETAAPEESRRKDRADRREGPTHHLGAVGSFWFLRNTNPPTFF